MSKITKKCVNCGKEIDNDGYCPKCVAFSSNPQKETKSGSKTKTTVANAVLINKDTNERFALTQLVNKVGRDADNDVSFPKDSYISRYHAWILYVKENYWVEDLGSTNGTMVNGAALNERKQIFPGDIVKFGRTEFIFELS